MNKKIYLASPHMCGEEQMYIKKAFDTNWIAPLGANVDNFEKEVAEYVGINSATALSSGTAAIHLALKSLGVGKGDIVFCSSLTFSATANPIIYQGAIPVFIDSEYESFNICPQALQKAFDIAIEKNKMPKALIIVNLYGQSVNYDAILEICNKYNVPVIEDAAESLGTKYKGKQTGTFGDFGVYSFNGNKIITTSGGGMLVGKDEEKISKAKFWATQSRENERHYEHKELGYNYRMSNIVAGIGRGQLKVLDERIAQKKNIYETYKESFKEIDEIEMIPVTKDSEPNYWLSVITIKEDSKVKPLDIILALEKDNIESRPVWKPMHLQPFFEKYDFVQVTDGISVSEDLFNRGVCLPSDTKNTEDDMNRIINIVKGCFELATC